MGDENKVNGENDSHNEQEPTSGEQKPSKRAFVPRKIERQPLPQDDIYEHQQIKPPEDRIVNPHNALRIRQALQVIAVIAIVGGLVFWLQGGFSSLGGNNSGNSSSMETGADLFSTNNSTTDFERFLLRADQPELVKASGELEPQEGEAFAISLEKRQRQIAISDRILSLSSDDEARSDAIQSKLRYLIERELLSMNNRITTDEMFVELKTACKEFEESGDAAVEQLVDIGYLLQYIREFLVEQDEDKRTPLMQSAESVFASVANESKAANTNAKTLYEYVKIIELLGLPEEKKVFENTFLQAFSQTSNKEISDLVLRITEKKLQDRFPDFSNNLASERPELIQEMMVQFRDLLAEGNAVSDDLVGIAVKRGIEMLGYGEVEPATEIVELIDKHDISDRSPTVNEEFEFLKNGIALMGAQIDISCMQQVDNQPAQFKLENASRKILYFASATGYQQSDGGFNDLFKRVEGALRAKKDLELVLVFIDRGNHSRALERMRVFARKSTFWQVWIINANTDAGREFFKNVPIVNTPFILVLDHDNKLVAMDPRINNIDEFSFTK